MVKPITTRLSEGFIKKINKLVREENLDFSTVVKRLLGRALEEERFERVFGDLSSHKISVSRAAKILGISLWELICLMKERNINWTGYGEKEVEKDLSLLGR